jgi:hypothetical protein
VNRGSWEIAIKRNKIRFSGILENPQATKDKFIGDWVAPATRENG